MSNQDAKKKKGVIQIQREKEELKEKTLEELKEENIIKIEKLIEELNKLEKIKDPNIRICPRCFSVRIKADDILNYMGIEGSYPACRCLDCGWRSKKWIYLDRTLAEGDIDKFQQTLEKEFDVEKEIE